ncbi:MAG: FAD-binding oxidoreductase [Alphaproteobacteria bacterium]|nr:FAD-binding oxidoreductase [Alphaproteobacteria bacterium]
MSSVQITDIDGQQAALEQDAIDAFGLGLRGGLLTQGDRDYDEVRRLWNGMRDKRPALIARCQGMADVINCVNFAREHNILLAVRGGGHNVAGHATCDGGMMLDLSLMKAVHVDPQTQIVRAQGGATLGDLDSETQVFGLAVPAGVVSTTGIAGLTLGGGTGWQTRKHGLTIDNLLSVDIVTADGQARVASQTENPDLFWALRGGGGNFGVVTSFEYQAHKVGPTIYLCCPFYPFEMSGEVTRAFRDFMDGAPEEFGGALLFWSVPANPYFPKENHGKATVIPILVYTGALEDGERLTAKIRGLGAPLVDLSGPLPWTGLQSMFDPFTPKQDLQYYWKNLYLKSADDEVLDYLIEIAATLPSKNTYLVLQPLAGALSRVGDDETAFGPRNMNYMFEFDCMWADPAESEKNIDWTRRNWADLQRYSTGSLYINFPGFGEEGVDLTRAAVGDASYERLAKIKAKYDPTNLFRINQNIEPAP